MMELVSVIIPIFNAEKYLDNCIKSVLEQTYSMIELILINDGSIDSSLQICNEFCQKDNRVKVIDKQNLGVSNTRNVGIDCAKGKWICFVDADDYIEKNYIEELVDTAKTKNADIVITSVVEIREKKTEMKYANDNRCWNGKEEIKSVMCSLLDNLSSGNRPTNPQTVGYSCAKLYKRETIASVRFQENISIREDAVFNLMVLNNANMVVSVDSPFYYYRIHEGSTMAKYDANYDREVDLFLTKCQYCWEEYNLPVKSYNVGVIYTYMLWLKKYALHSDAKRNYIEKHNIICASFKDERWATAFSSIQWRSLNKRYRLLKIIYLLKSCEGIIFLLWIANIKGRK